ncbi:transcriptional regulator CynR [Paraburkholderia phosphatilytica]|uniref:transcriptional regulator CynR n=1 Tax=Paraburkholderia phosphatilytica TaxID=2282883 RepID=UPI001F0B9255|nr:transcriptional regulator CynR [Paraburkholderia phosphatilytica]
MLRQIRYLLAVAEHRNFTRAADAMRVSQPALSQQIRQLESELGGPVFDRSGRAVTLTDFGRIYLEHARRALRDLEAGERALHDVRDLSAGRLRLAYTPTFTEYLIGPLIAQFHETYPRIQVELTEASLEDIEAQLAADEIDLAIGFADVRSDEIETTPIFSERLTLVLGDSHPLAARTKPLAAAELDTLPLALLTRGFVSRYFADSYFHAHGLKPPIVLQGNSISALLKIVRDGTVATLLPDAMRREHRELGYVDLDPPFPVRTVALLRRKNGYRTAASLALAATLQAMLMDGVLTDLTADRPIPASA